MGRERKCILCQIVYSSKQEMDEHMRSMLHHRELENLKGRDCGHECRVCQVTVVGLTDYANHISSPLHKQRVEAVEREGAGNDQEEEYFDKELVKLIEKRKELIRKEEEAAAKRAKEEEERKRQQLQQQRFNEARNYLRQKGASWDWRHSNLPQSRGFKGSNWQGAWNGGNTSGGRAQDVQEDPRSNWHNSRQGKSATWHAQEPPNLQTWNSGERAGGSLHSRDGWGSKRWDPEQFSAHQRGRAPWLSNGGSTNGVYSRNSGLNWEQTKQPLMEPANRMDFTNEKMPLSSSFEHIESQYKQQDISQDGRSNGNQNREGPSTELDHNNGMGPKTFGSNPKLDKACRWSPYPPTNSLPHKDPHPSPLEKHPKGPPAQVRDVDLRQRRDTSLGTQPSKKPPRWDQKAEQQRTASPEHSVEEGESRKHKGSSTKSSSSSSSRRDSQTSTSSGSAKQRATKPSELPEKRLSSTSSTPKTQLSRASSQDSVQSKSSQHSGSSSKSSHSEVLPSVQEQQLAEMLRKAKETLLDKRDLSTDQRMETVLHIEEEQQVESSECKVEANKGKKSRQDRINPKVDRVTDPIRHQPGSEETVESVMSPTDNNLSLQSIQVSTSTVESPRAALSAREEEEEEEREKGTGSVAADEAMQAVDAGPGSDGDVCRGSEAQTSSGATLPTLNNKQSLPALKRDLTRHIGSKSKGGSHEPNLNIARRIRNMSGTRKGEMEKDSGLKPTLRQLISSSGSRRCVNWDQVYQEVSRKKQEQGKGMPRFGIEMVAYDQEGLSQEEEDIPLAEGFQWESLFDSQPAIAPVTPRKRSLSESSIAPDRLAANLSLFSAQTAGERASREAPCRPGRQSSEQQGSSSPTPTAAYGSRDNQEEATHGLCEAKPLGQPEGPIGALQRSDSVIGDSSSGTEQNDTLAAGKKRRAAGDIPSPEIPSLERKNKRRKIKSKKERLQVDQLLAVSLREEELSRSLQTVDNGLIQARAALQAAYIEVQRLLVVKQQVSMEMSTLRTKRIELLQGMQGNLESTAQPKVKEMEEEMTVTTEPHMPSMLSPVTDTPAPAPAPAPASCPRQASQSPLNQLQRCPTPPSFLTPGQANASTQSVVIKQEPLSPSTVNTEPDPVESTVHGAHSTTPEPPTPALNGQSVIGRRPESRKASIDPPQESLRVSAECKESSSGMDQSMERGVQVTWDRRLLPADSKPLPPLLPTSRRGSRAGALDPTASPPHESSPVHPISTQPAVPTFLPPPQPEPKNGKRVRKLKKKRVLRKAQGAEQPENSDTELDGETPLTSRPVRRLRTVRRKSSTFLVSTSTPPPTGEDVDMDREEALGPVSPGTKPGQEDSDSSLEMVELPQAAPAEVVTIDTSDPEDGHMEVTVTSPLPDVHPSAPDSPVAELQKLACNEVTSTSEMEVSTIVKTCESDVQLPLTSVKVSKRSSVDMTSDPGEDDIATEGVFEGHQETVNAMQIHKGLLYTCSGDRTVRAFNLVSRKCVAVFEGHSTKVNCLVVSCGPGLQQRLYSGSSDQTIRCYSLRTRECLEQFSLPDRVLCLHSRWKVLYAGLANGTVVRFNLKTNKHMDVFECNGPRAVSCLATAQEGARRILLVGSYDSTISVRDAKNGLLLRTLEGHTKTVLCMKVVNDLVFSGSSDQSVHAHNIHTGELVRIYKGHSHAVTVVAILGKVMITACLDKLVRVYELQSHDRLQVYGGHKDMVMCMAIHNSMIYTGCYDGSVQAVKLNLIQNHRCWWHGCSLNFGVMEHLQQHVLNDHTSSNFQTLKCRWRNCDEFFTARNSSKQGVAKHMQNHAEEESKVES